MRDSPVLLYQQSVRTELPQLLKNMYTLAIAYSPTKKESMTLERGYYTIGRSDANDICIVNEYVSSRHCTLLIVDDANNVRNCLVIDGRLYSSKKSTNGVWLNGKRVDKELLKHQDVIQFSSHEYPSITFLTDAATEEGDTAAHEREHEEVN